MQIRFFDRFSNYYIPGGWKSFAISILATILVSYLHFSAKSVHSVIHFFHYYFFYLIVIYSAHKFGFLGGLISSFILSLIYNPRVYLIFSIDTDLLRPIIEVIMMYTLGIFSGIFSQKLYVEKEKLRKVSEELKLSLELLEKSMAEKIRMEKEIAKSDRLRVLGQLTAGIAHEIRNPLAAIRSGINLIKNGQQDDRIIDVVTSEIDRLNKFVERFLQYAKGGKVEDVDINVKELIEELAELVRLTSKDRQNLTFNCSTELNEGVLIRGDKNYLKQAIYNILLNSIEAVSLHKDQGLISFRGYIEGEKVVFEITDNGPGIEKSLMDAIFEPFFTTKETGTGLGLTIASKIIKEHNGEIIIENNGGTKFMIKIPTVNLLVNE